MSKLNLTVFTLACLIAPLGAQAGAEAEFKEVYSAAVATHEAAADHQWTTTTKTLEAADSAAQNGERDTALSLAREARQLAEASVAQREDQQKSWRYLVVD